MNKSLLNILSSRGLRSRSSRPVANSVLNDDFPQGKHEVFRLPQRRVRVQRDVVLVAVIFRLPLSLAGQLLRRVVTDLRFTAGLLAAGRPLRVAILQRAEAHRRCRQQTILLPRVFCFLFVLTGDSSCLVVARLPGNSHREHAHENGS